ncbi:unnamed protein product [Leptidea sinapis]|uniref:Uncharacterized protein n=1 Tax=Leptidea sinapis TaxID=189913 RepID=A0A5E4QI37_9NEOP|nr:unnamed protein product [Leptidea sinapis]
MDSKGTSSPMRNKQEQDLVNLDDNSSKCCMKQRGQGDVDYGGSSSLSNEENCARVELNYHRKSEFNSVSTNENIVHPSQNNVVISDHLPNNGSSSHSSQVSSEINCKMSTNKGDQTDKIDKLSKHDIGDSNAPSTSGLSCPSNDKIFNLPGPSEARENKKRPSSLKLKRANVDGDDSSSDTGNDDYSLGSEDGCIYTYRGAMPPQQVAPVPMAQGSRGSSPDMDYLEMDFDPGPSCEADTGDESSPEVDIEVPNIPEGDEPEIRGISPEYQPAPVPPLLINPIVARPPRASIFDFATTTEETPVEKDVVAKKVKVVRTEYIIHTTQKGEKIKVKRTMTHCPEIEPSGVHNSSGDLVTPREVLKYGEDHRDVSMAHKINQGESATLESANLISAIYHVNMAKKLINEKPISDMEGHSLQMDVEAGPSTSDSTPCVEPPRCMVWTEREACERQVTQIGTSACGATAVVNVFLALGVPVNIERINSEVGTRQRANNAQIPRYILSRSIAGCTAADIVNGLQRASDGLVTARFFPTFPERSMSLSHWLADWISLGAVPILTLNLQQGCEGDVPDAWHHQMVFGVSPRGIFMCNPVECVPENVVWCRLVSPSVLLLRARDVVARYNPETDMSVLTAVPDIRFHKMNVLGESRNFTRQVSLMLVINDNDRDHKSSDYITIIITILARC